MHGPTLETHEFKSKHVDTFIFIPKYSNISIQKVEVVVGKAK